MPAKKKTPITIQAAILTIAGGGIFVIVGAILTPLVQDWLAHPTPPTLTLTATTQPTTVSSIATDSPIVLNPTWIDREGSVLVLNNQVLIHLVKLNLGFSDSVDISITIGAESKEFTMVEPGERVTFEYLGADYFVTVMQIIGTQTQISVERILPTE